MKPKLKSGKNTASIIPVLAKTITFAIAAKPNFYQAGGKSAAHQREIGGPIRNMNMNVIDMTLVVPNVSGPQIFTK